MGFLSENKVFILCYLLFQAFFKVDMVDYKVTVHTGDYLHAGTFNQIHLNLVGTEGQSERQLLPPIDLRGHSSFTKGAVAYFVLSTLSTIGKLLLIEVDKKSLPLVEENSWFLNKVVVTSPDGRSHTVPIYSWIDNDSVHRFREATALKVFEDTHPIGKNSRMWEINERRLEYIWDVYAEGIPHCIKAEEPTSLPPEVRFSHTKSSEFLFTRTALMTELKLKGLADKAEGWANIDDIARVFCCRHSNVLDYVREHWKEDSFFGYQFLNGINPTKIRRCDKIPSNFPVTDDMVFPDGQTTLADEMQKGNLFLCDYKSLDGVNTNTINGKKQYLMAPLVLLHKTPDDKLMPIAIQLKQNAADDNPIFLPSDPEYDWLLAKTYVRSSDFIEHQLNVHLLRTHLLAEVYTVSLLRHLPMVHPLYKLLIPHTRYTLQINFLARKLLISETGFISQFSASGGEGSRTVLQRSLAKVNYTSLCLPDNIAERGMQDIPNYFYRDDGLKLWDIINRFVKGVIEHYYEHDDDVQKDSELQMWIADIFEHGFLSRESSGIPQNFTSVPQLIKFVTMVIFTASAQHAAVNSGQYDYDGWMPNSPMSLKLPPPTEKGIANENTLLETLHDVNGAVQGMAVIWLLSKQSSDFVSLGNYPMEHFLEETPLKLIKAFQGELEVLTTMIKVRNDELELPYTYLNPPEIENSVAI